MDTRIFNLNMSVEATSAYIILDRLADQGAPLTVEEILPYWNAEKGKLSDALEELEERAVIARAGGDSPAKYLLMPHEEWR